MFKIHKEELEVNGKKLLIYLKKKNPDSYQKVIKQLNLRK